MLRRGSRSPRLLVPANSEIAERFAELEPWRTRFEIEGEPYGGDLDYTGDRRVAAFFDWFGSPRTILELSSFEGAHTLQLAAPPTTGRVLGIEGRKENVERARLVEELLGRGNAEFAVDDLEAVDLTAYGRFDATFCAGLLYHLVSPWRLLGEIARVSDRLFLDTHYWTGPDTVEVDGYVGGWFEEGGYEDPLSGLDRRSFWLTRPSLLKALTESGWAVQELVDHENWAGAGARAWLGCVRPGAQSDVRSDASTG
jgi:SAM-dependent methyltransferase